jgi:cellulose synthase/poly-beta-1,6-N-acetylglucosamine synthase-like glycosyltransferase
MDHSAFEVLVVDNNSKDNTKDVVSDFSQSHPDLNIRYLLETKQGTSFARNCGIQAAKGEILCFTEDDAAPFPDWLEKLVNPLIEMGAGCGGGPIYLDYQGQDRPLHLQGDLQGLVGGFHLPYTEASVVSTWIEYPWGGNMAFRKDVFNDLGFFDTELGPSGERRLTAEETEYIQRVHQRGWKVLYIPSAKVHHFVPPERLTKSHLYRVGRGLASSHVFLTSDPRLHMIIRWYLSDAWYALRMFVKFIGAVLQRKALWFDDYMRFWIVAMRLPIRFRMLFEKKSSLNLVPKKVGSD